ncbi:MAG: hypothetical protein Q8L88_01700 [Bacteroidota bacterium]|nr:hypothetical protein [Bacteroidota bacterium]
MMNSLMISCKKATGLIEKRSVIGLSFAEKFQLHIHTAMCSACTNYQKQSVLIDNMLKHTSKHLPANIPAENTDHVSGLISKILNKKNS